MIKRNVNFGYLNPHAAIKYSEKELAEVDNYKLNTIEDTDIDSYDDIVWQARSRFNQRLRSEE